MNYYRVDVVDRDTGWRQQLGIFKADDHITAQLKAEKEYRGLARRLETGKIVIESTECDAPPPKRQRVARPKTANLPL